MTQTFAEENVTNVMKSYKIFALVVSIIILVFVLYVASDAYKRASHIMADATVVDAMIKDVTFREQSGKRGRTSSYTDFRIEFDVDGKTYSKEESFPSANATRYLEAKTIEVAYLNSDPSQFDRHALLLDQSIPAIAKRMVILMGIVGLFFVLLGFWIRSRLRKNIGQRITPV